MELSGKGLGQVVMNMLGATDGGQQESSAGQIWVHGMSLRWWMDS